MPKGDAYKTWRELLATKCTVCGKSRKECRRTLKIGRFPRMRERW